MKPPSNNFEKKSEEKKSKISLKWKITLSLFIFTGIIIVILWLFQVVFLGDIYETIKYRQLEYASDAILSSQSEEKLVSNTEDYAGKYEICILVYDLTDNEIISSQDTMKNCFLHRFVLMEMKDGTLRLNTELANKYRQAAAEAGGRAYIINQTEFQDHAGGKSPSPPDYENTNVMMVLNAKTKDGNDVVIFLNTILEPVSATVTTLNSMLFIISGLILVIAMLLGAFISHHISKSISSITTNARKLATGDYSVTFKGDGYQEIEELASTMNYTASELSKVDQLKTDLISNISHDLRTPLTLIGGYAEMMRDLPDETTPENLQIIIDETNRMKNLVNDVLDISKIQSGTNQFDMQDFPLTNCIESELTRYNKLRDKEGYSIVFEYGEMVTVHGDCNCIMRAVYNLVNNAVVHAGIDKLITVKQSVDTKHHKVRIAVIDNGEGIDPDKLELIWERYYKVDQTHKRAQIGTGLGLSIVKNIIQAHGGSYGVTSTKGQGSTFYFEIDYQRIDPLIYPTTPETNNP